MKPNRWIETSRAVYARLLNLYPLAHRNEYGQAMLQLFVDQCRSAADRRGGWGLATLWFRTLFDLGTSVLSEHLSAPGAQSGLLDAIPDRPLPWKGVALVLVPGLILFASQVAQMTGENWFFTTLIWTPYVLMAVVLLAWLVTRRYPVWGLMPLGLLCSNLVYYGIRLLTTWKPSSYGAPAVATKFLSVISNGVNGLQSLYFRMIEVGPISHLWMAAPFLLVPALLVVLYQRRKPLARVPWVLLGAYLLLSSAQLGLRIQNYLDSLQLSVDHANLYDALMNTELALAGTFAPVGRTIVGFWTLYGSGAFLFLIFAGILLARRYGDLAILFPLGYVLGGIVYGYYNVYEDTMLYLVIGMVLLYRILIAVVAPVWISRSSGRRRDWALAVSIGLALTAQVLLREIMVSYLSLSYEGSAGLITAAMRLTMIVDPLVVAVGLALAISLYRPAIPTAAAQNTVPKALSEIAPE